MVCRMLKESVSNIQMCIDTGYELFRAFVTFALHITVCDSGMIANVFTVLK